MSVPSLDEAPASSRVQQGHSCGSKQEREREERKRRKREGESNGKQKLKEKDEIRSEPF